MTPKGRIRQVGLIPEEILGKRITIVGAGAVGSIATIALAKMGFTNLAVCDFDTVDEENIGVQFYRYKDIGKTKVGALQEIVEEFSGTQIITYHGKYKPNLCDVIISAVDNMETRAEIYRDFSRRGFSKFMVDPRMGAEHVSIFTMLQEDEEGRKKLYEPTLVPDDSIENEPCTARTTTYTAMMLGGLVAQVTRDLLADRNPPKVAHWSIKDYDFMRLI